MFDLITDRRNAKGKVIAGNHYRRVVNAGVVEYERPLASGVWYAEDGTLIRDEFKAEREAKEAMELQKAQDAATAKAAAEAKLQSEREELEALRAEKAKWQALATGKQTQKA